MFIYYYYYLLIYWFSFFFKEITTTFQKGCIKLCKSDSEDFNTLDFKNIIFQINAVLLFFKKKKG